MIRLQGTLWTYGPLNCPGTFDRSATLCDGCGCEPHHDQLLFKVREYLVMLTRSFFRLPPGVKRAAAEQLLKELDDAVSRGARLVEPQA